MERDRQEMGSAHALGIVGLEKIAKFMTDNHPTPLAGRAGKKILC
jgi:hypothetical protein